MSDVATKRRRCFFGTDGVRDVANRGSMTPEMALRLGRAYVLFLTERGFPRPRIVVGRDTRRSGPMLEAALAAGMTSAGADVVCVGVTPTPSVGFGVRLFSAQGGAVISASHNPAEYNGIKFLDGAGCKLSDDDELSIEDYLGDNLIDEWRPSGASVGSIESRECDFNRQYEDHVLDLVGHVGLDRASILFDCANGALSPIVSDMIGRMGMVNSSAIGNLPDGLNINEKCGVMAIEGLCREVVGRGMSLGIAYDGDADRVLLSDGKGRVLDGDIMLWIIGRWLHSRKELGSGVVATVMGNMALDRHLKDDGIDVYRCPVGDRYVFQTMVERDARLGGEQSGHVIVFPYTKTGDGLCTGFLFLRACTELKEDIDTLVDRFGRFPQKLTNITVKDKNRIMNDGDIASAVESASRDLGDIGRVFLRPSGTEPFVRLLVECQDPNLMEEVSSDLQRRILEMIG
ncbi:phosphoglucosamine mutase [Dethiosulfovibrio sp. F2B]|uniref:phosphoglucosamine mutase n=1 Tax=Dethiosulfovibrio faecalis TaxID=2720018 RepID=UPI001F17A4AF|nr:phosphoglucosamine mutase [Dethiosulfovibrio faecalis]MCF4152096.1 phosphoglucosamine mutase [Dethiosulfovibrio faecalis]